ncbi:MAG: hypothetical protein LC797_24435 [Chloroflexi bacterium]|nr:hypothetical protein [Chloroflexota bacterium]
MEDTWVESLRDGDLFWQLRRPVLLVLLSSLVAGPLVVLALDWRNLSSYASQTPLAETVAASNHALSPTTDQVPLAVAGVSSDQTSSTVGPTPSEAQDATPSVRELVAATVLPSPTASPSPMPTTAATFTPTNLQAPTLMPSPTTIVTAELVWETLLPRLDAAWGADTGATITLLEEFRARFPEFEPAQDKLYAALMAQANTLAQNGATDAAGETLAQAKALVPRRIEADAALLALRRATPAPPRQAAPVQDTPRSSPLAPLVRPQPAPTARPAPAPQPAPVAPLVAEAPLPTPTKIPFRPPARP